MQGHHCNVRGNVNLGLYIDHGMGVEGPPPHGRWINPCLVGAATIDAAPGRHVIRFPARSLGDQGRNPYCQICQQVCEYCSHVATMG
jgi:hypothetical protein